MKKLFFLGTLCFMALSVCAQEFVDLGLPSGTKWKSVNESDLSNYNAALVEFNDNLPTYAQFEELKEKCTWEWKESGFKVTGPNGNSIFLPTTSTQDCSGDWLDSSLGSYWTSSSFGQERAWVLGLTAAGGVMGEADRCSWRAVRLVQKKMKE